MDSLFRVTINRVNNSLNGVLGVMSINNVPHFMTLERPWGSNKPNVSCIPAGHYVCDRVESPRFGETFEVKDVPGRSHILFHAGNTIEDSKGCIMISIGFNAFALRDSMEALTRFRDLMKFKHFFSLTITWPGVPSNEKSIY